MTCWFAGGTGVRVANSSGEAELRTAVYDRTNGKLTMNSLPGRHQMEVCRSQVCYFRDTASVTSLVGDEYLTLKKFEAFDIGGEVYRVEFTEGGHKDHIANHEAYLHLACGMYGYAKSHMHLLLKWACDRGYRPLYVDTDCAAMVVPRDALQTIKDAWVPEKKALGGFALDGKLEPKGIFTQFASIGPKKVAFWKADGAAEFVMGGLRASHNVHVDVPQERMGGELREREGRDR